MVVAARPGRPPATGNVRAPSLPLCQPVRSFGGQPSPSWQACFGFGSSARRKFPTDKLRNAQLLNDIQIPSTRLDDHPNRAN